MELNYNITLISIKIKHKNHTQMMVTNRRNNIKLIPNAIEGLFIFNQNFQIIQGRKQKQHIQLLVSFLHQSGSITIGGAIMLNRFELVPSEEILEVKLHNCLDQAARCQLIINSITPVEEVSPRKRVETFDFPKVSISHLFPSPKSKSTFTSDLFNSGSNLFSGFKSTKATSEKSAHLDQQSLKLEKELTQYKLLLKNERQRSKELLEEVQRLEQLRQKDHQRKLRLQFQQQQWISEKQRLQLLLKRSQLQNQKCRQIFIKEIQKLNRVIQHKGSANVPNDSSFRLKKTQTQSSQLSEVQKQKKTCMKKTNKEFSPNHEQDHLKLMIFSPEHRNIKKVLDFECLRTQNDQKDTK